MNGPSGGSIGGPGRHGSSRIGPDQIYIHKRVEETDSPVEYILNVVFDSVEDLQSNHIAMIAFSLNDPNVLVQGKNGRPLKNERSCKITWN